MGLCQICNQEDQDCRTLRLQYLYDLSEISDKLKKEEMVIEPVNDHKTKNVFQVVCSWISDMLRKKKKSVFWTICTCKDCRGEFLGILRCWANGQFVTQIEDDPERNIPVRLDGRIVMMNTEEWQAHTTSLGEPDRAPHRLIVGEPQQN